ncbi:MAG TPA: AAA domain-containing protein [Bryobacteraceae bacterium]
MSPAEREARILRYWKAVELLSPQKIPRLNPNNRSEPVLRAGGETPLPWDLSGWFRPPESGRKWRFTAYCGLYKLGRVRAFLENKFGRDTTSFDRRPDGESCLFALQIASDGRPLLDTFVLASCPWAVGRLKNATSGGDAWTAGFEASAKEMALRLAERFCIREDDEIGRALNRNPEIHVGRPIQPNDLETEIECIADALGISGILKPKDLRIAARQVEEKYQFHADSDDFLNSFFLRDLEKIAEEAARSNNSAVLSRFLSPDQAVHPEQRCDVRTSLNALWRNTSPGMIPPARWPASPDEPLYFSQQFAVNSALEAFEQQASPIFGVNGPPGTGKTTLLRDLIASVLVRRAQALAKLRRPEQAFTGDPAHWNTAGFERSIFLWREELLGFEIVVASANNRAVENVTLEIPAQRAIAEEYLSQIEYFGDFAGRLLSERKRKEAEQAGTEAWGLLAARLGSKKNRSRFISKFWYADKEATEPRTRSQNGFQKYLQTVKPRPSAWKQAVTAFEEALKAEAVIREERIAAWKAVEMQASLQNRLASLCSQRELAEAAAAKVREQAESAACSHEAYQSKRQEALTARLEHQAFKPGLVDALFTFGTSYREWREKDRILAAAVEAREKELNQARSEYDSLRQNIDNAEEQIAKLTSEFSGQENILNRQNQSIDELRRKLGKAFPNKETWLTNPDERELSSPWTDEGWNRARTQVLIEALHLHRTFIECVPDKIRKNLHGAMDILSGKVSPQVDSKALQSAWATLFFVIPVVSTTFASFDRLFSHCGRESIGWLLIDEAGQATPQSTAGALWRARRAVIVGDPRQLQPIVPLPFTAQQALRAHFGVEETWLPSKHSAQTVADRVSHFGTWLVSENSDEPFWVGSPLRVHRRCEKQIFDISNQIAYSGQMVYDTREVPLPLPPSAWIDVAAAECDDHWIPAEGIVVELLVTDLLRSGVSGDRILLISPFRAVARKLREIAARYGIAGAGTIHVSQGKEADMVILVLGGDPRRLGAKDWASEKPNLLNVAVSRAKRRLFIVGNRAEWSEYPNFADAAALLPQEEKARERAAGSLR